MTRKPNILAALSFTILAVFMCASAILATNASAKTYVPKPHAKCKGGYIAKTVTKRELKGKRPHRHVVKVKVRECVSKPKAKPVTTTTTTTVTTPVSTPAPTAPTTVRATIDPSFTEDPSNPMSVTFTYGASDVGAGSLPDGTITLGIFEHDQTAASYQCTSNVGGGQDTASCTVTLSNYGLWDLSVTYSGGGDVSSTGATETVDIEAPAPLAPIATTVSLALGSSTTFDSWNGVSPAPFGLYENGYDIALAATSDNPESPGYVETLTDVTTGQTVTLPATSTCCAVQFTTSISTYPDGVGTQEIPAGDMHVSGFSNWPANTDTFDVSVATAATQDYAASSSSASVQVWPIN
jgi:hypothetical protein